MIKWHQERFATLVIVALFVGISFNIAQEPGSIVQAAGARQKSPFVLGMGDSVGWGFQAFPVDPNTTFPGFVDRFAERIERSPRRMVAKVNYSCNGESTTTMIQGVPSPSGLQCIGKALYDSPAHDDYNGSQLSAAVSFLQQQVGEGIVLLNIGGNDPFDNPTVAACNFEMSCLTQAFQLPDVRSAVYQSSFANYKTILSALLASNSHVRILAINTYELDDNDPLTATGIIDVANTALADAVRSIGNPRVTLVDTTTIFTPTAVCEGALTEWCLDEAPYLSVHPTDAGYVTLTDIICDASRTSRTPDNQLTCRPGKDPKPVGHGRVKPHHSRSRHSR